MAMPKAQKYKNAKPKLDNKQEIYHPLDYSFKTLSFFEDLLREKQRSRTKKAVDLEDEVTPDCSTDCLDIVQSYSTALKVNNNMLNLWDDFSKTIHKLFADPAETLAWIDLSFNDFKTIDVALLDLPNLTMLYLHGNNIFNISETNKLAALRKLKSLTLHGNPIEVSVGYRQHVISTIPQLQTFDFSGITKNDRTIAETWQQRNTTSKPRTKK